MPVSKARLALDEETVKLWHLGDDGRKARRSDRRRGARQGAGLERDIHPEAPLIVIAGMGIGTG